jgi:hypothetical protein
MNNSDQWGFRKGGPLKLGPIRYTIPGIVPMYSLGSLGCLGADRICGRISTSPPPPPPGTQASVPRFPKFPSCPGGAAKGKQMKVITTHACTREFIQKNVWTQSGCGRKYPQGDYGNRQSNLADGDDDDEEYDIEDEPTATGLILRHPSPRTRDTLGNIESRNIKMVLGQLSVRLTAHAVRHAEMRA